MMSAGKQLRVYLEHARLILSADQIMKFEKLAYEIEEFEKIVHEMRKQQKAFYRTKAPDIKRDHLLRSKFLENQVDTILSRNGWDDQQEIF